LYFCIDKFNNFILYNSIFMEKFNANLKNWLDSLGRLDRNKATKLICDACIIDRSKLYNWTNAGTKVEPLYQERINEVRKNFKQLKAS